MMYNVVDAYTAPSEGIKATKIEWLLHKIRNIRCSFILSIGIIRWISIEFIRKSAPYGIFKVLWVFRNRKWNYNITAECWALMHTFPAYVFYSYLHLMYPRTCTQLPSKPWRAGGTVYVSWARDRLPACLPSSIPFCISLNLCSNCFSSLSMCQCIIQLLWRNCTVEK